MGIPPISHLGESLTFTRELPMYAVGESPTLKKKELMIAILRYSTSRRSVKLVSSQTAHGAPSKLHRRDTNPNPDHPYLQEVERT